MSEQTQVHLPEEAPLFSSHVCYTPELHQEFQAGYRLSRPLQTPLNLCLVGICLLYLFLLPDRTLAWTFLFLGTVLVLTRLSLLIPRKKGSFAYKQMLYTQGGTAPRQTVRFYRDSVYSTNEEYGVSVCYPFSEVSRIIETKHLLLLVLKFKLALVVDKATLEGGSAQELNSHLLRRCPHVRQKIHTDRSGRITNLLVIAALLLTMAAAATSLI